MGIIKRAKRKLKKIIMGNEPQKPEPKPVEEIPEPEISEEERLEQERLDTERAELEEVRNRLRTVESDYVWAFIAGQYSQDFRGNPKYLFVYINRYRKDIKTYWLCSDEDTIAQVRELGFSAYKVESPAAEYAAAHTGVLVVEQVKSVIPEGFENAKYINLWHGVGFKRIERKLFVGEIRLELARKYVRYNSYFRDHQLLTVTSPEIEKEFGEDCGVDEDQFMRTGYLRCMYQQNYDKIVSFDHDLRRIKGLPENTRLAVYAPTYRAKQGGTFSRAITDLEALYRCCQENNILMIFKVHPNMENEVGFLRAWETYGDRPYFWFWDNKNDFYEIMDQMDLAIVDYSAITSDMVAVGIKHYIRYIFDHEEYFQEGMTQGDYEERSIGKACYSFEELLEDIKTFEDRDDSAQFEKITEKLWDYAGGKDDFEKVIAQVMDFKVKERPYRNLYSFDIFDTLFTRKVLAPEGIFYYVQEKMEEAGGYPFALVKNYPSIRHSSEFNVRDYYRKTKEERDSDRLEITFDEIFVRMADVYALTEDQTTRLKEWELEAELDNVIPLEEQISRVKELKAAGETVVLISDMYLSKEFVKELLKKADPMLADLPLFLSSEYGVQKTTQELFFEVYKSFEPYYNFKKWIHCGDNGNADVRQPGRFRIKTQPVKRPQFGDFQTQLVEELRTYDSYQVAALQSRMIQNAVYDKDESVISYVALCFVPYVDWAVRDALRRGYETLYFISRDGYHLKRIADAIIEKRGLKIKTKYIYASRRTWRIPSFIHEVDEGFWLPQGSFSNLNSTEKLFAAMDLDEEKFRELFPFIEPDNIEFANKREINSLVEIFRNSKEYNEYLLKRAAEKRELVSGYLRQEIDPSERFAVVEYWGRGYTQDCMVRLWQEIVGEEADVPFYYSRSILPTQGSSVRYNFITNDSRQIYIEAIFANMPYKSIEEYELKEGRIEPVINPIPYDRNLYDSMDRLLPEFAGAYAGLDLLHPEDTDHMLYEFALNFYRNNLDNEYFINLVGTLVDSVSLYGDKRQFAPPYTMEELDMFQEKELGRGSMLITTSITMSISRSPEDVKKRYNEMYQILPGDNVAGGRLLSLNEQEQNREAKQEYDVLVIESEKFSTWYNEMAAEQPVKDLILLISDKKQIEGTSLELVNLELQKQTRYEVEVLQVRRKQKAKKALAKKVASARYILVSNAVELFCKTVFRNETEEIRLCNTAFSIYNRALMVNHFLKWKMKYLQMSRRNNIAVLQIPSKKSEKKFRKSYSRDSRTRCQLLGCCSTDIYYIEGIKEDCRKELEEIFPEAAEKKILLYMPAGRPSRDCREWAYMLDMDRLQQYIGDEYIVVINMSKAYCPKIVMNQLDIPGFCKNLTSEMNIRRLMIAADVIVGDYRDVFFEAALLHKPTYMTTGDHETVLARSRVLDDICYEDIAFAPMVETSLDLAEQLKKIDAYDYAPMERFKEEMLNDCDGHSVKRVIDYLMDSKSLNGGEQQ